MGKNNYATVSWTVDDVIENCKQLGIHVKKNNVKEALILNEKEIVDAMILAGWQVIEESLSE